MPTSSFAKNQIPVNPQQKPLGEGRRCTPFKQTPQKNPRTSPNDNQIKKQVRPLSQQINRLEPANGSLSPRKTKSNVNLETPPTPSSRQNQSQTCSKDKTEKQFQKVNSNQTGNTHKNEPRTTLQKFNRNHKDQEATAPTRPLSQNHNNKSRQGFIQKKSNKENASMLALVIEQEALFQKLNNKEEETERPLSQRSCRNRIKQKDVLLESAFNKTEGVERLPSERSNRNQGSVESSLEKPHGKLKILRRPIYPTSYQNRTEKKIENIKGPQRSYPKQINQENSTLPKVHGKIEESRKSDANKTVQDSDKTEKSLSPFKNQIGKKGLPLKDSTKVTDKSADSIKPSSRGQTERERLLFDKLIGRNEELKRSLHQNQTKQEDIKTEDLLKPLHQRSHQNERQPETLPLRSLSSDRKKIKTKTLPIEEAADKKKMSTRQLHPFDQKRLKLEEQRGKYNTWTKFDQQGENAKPSSQAEDRTRISQELLPKTSSRGDRINKQSVAARSSLNTYASLIKEFETLLKDKNTAKSTRRDLIKCTSLSCLKQNRISRIPVLIKRPILRYNDDSCKTTEKKDKSFSDEKELNTCVYSEDTRRQTEKQKELVELPFESFVEYNISDNYPREIVRDELHYRTEIYVSPETSKSVEDMSNTTENIASDDFYEAKYRKRSRYSESTKLENNIRRHSRHYRNIKRALTRMPNAQPIAFMLVKKHKEEDCGRLTKRKNTTDFRKHFDGCESIVCTPSRSKNQLYSNKTEDSENECDCLVCRSLLGKLNPNEAPLNAEKQFLNQSSNITGIDEIELETERLKTRMAELKDDNAVSLGIINKQDETSRPSTFDNLPPKNMNYMLPQRLYSFRHEHIKPIRNVTRLSKKDISNLLSQSTSTLNKRLAKKVSGAQFDNANPLNPFYDLKQFGNDNNNVDYKPVIFHGPYELRHEKGNDTSLDDSLSSDNDQDDRSERFNGLANTVREIFTLGKMLVNTIVRYG